MLTMGMRRDPLAHAIAVLGWTGAEWPNVASVVTTQF
jgi:hypothetical protein